MRRSSCGGAGAEGQAGRRLRLRAAGGGDDGELRGAEAGRDPLGDARRDRPAAAPGRCLPAARLRHLPRGLGRGDGGIMRQRRDGRGGRPRRGLRRPHRPLLAEGDGAADRRRDPRGDRPQLLDRDLGEQVLAKITSELGKPAGLVVLTRERGAGALRGRVPRPDSRHRPEDGRAPAPRWGSAPWPTCAPATRRSCGGTLSARGRASGCSRRAPLRRRLAPLTTCARPSRSRRETTFDVDVADHAALAAHRCAALAEELCRRLRARGCGGGRSGSRCGSTTGPTSPRSHTVERADQRPDVVTARRARPVAGLLAAPAGAAARRPASPQFGEAEPAARGGRRPQLSRRSPARRFPERSERAGRPSGSKHDAQAREAEPRLGRRGQVVVAAGRRKARGR